MPMRSYQCPDCGTTKDALEPISAPPTRECENCGGVMERALSAPSFSVGGAGAYSKKMKV